MTLEEKYFSMSRGSSQREEAPPPRQAPSRRRVQEEWDEPPRRGKKPTQKKPSRQAVKPRRSRAASIGLGAYKALVLVSALIVAAYIGLQVMSKAPEQKPPVDKTTPVVTGDGGEDTSQTTDPNALCAGRMSIIFSWRPPMWKASERTP